MKNYLLSTLFLIFSYLTGEGQTEKGQTQIIPAIFLCTDTATYPNGTMLTYEQSIKVQGFSFHIKGFVKQELHNTAEGVIDPGFSKCIDDNGNTISCYQDYWVTIEKLGGDRKPLSKSIIVWQVK